MKCSFWKWNSEHSAAVCSVQYFIILLLLISIVPFVFTSCQPKAEPPLTIAAAASLRYLAEDLITEFEQETGQSCALVVGSTGKLSAQIIAGAPYDLLLSADARYPQLLAKADKTLGPIRTFNYSRLVLWSLDSLAPLHLDSLAPNDRLAIANPNTAPFGHLADSLLRLRSDYANNLAPKIVYGESIAQVNQFVSTGAVKYGLTAALMMEATELKKLGHWTAFGQASIPQTIVILTGQSIEKAKTFQEFVLGEMPNG